MGIWIGILIFLFLVFNDIFGLADLFEGCLPGLIIMGVGIAITIAAFGINPLLGIIVGYFVLQGWKRM